MSSIEILQKIGQTHLLKDFDLFSEQQKCALLKQIKALNLKYLKKQQDLLISPPQLSLEVEPYRQVHKSVSKEEQAIGKQLLKQGAMGALLVAGGQGTRLNFAGPKGMFPISLIKNKSLFQLFAEKIRAASNWAARPLFLSIMTSPLNDTETKVFFEQHHFFGLERSQVDFFSQSTLPYLDDNGHLILTSMKKIAEGADGNGSALKGFVQSGIWEKWQTNGVRWVSFVMIDNPLADPMDFNLLGLHAKRDKEVTFKAVLRKDVDEKLGIFVQTAKQLKVIEYSEAPPSLWKAKVKDHLEYQLANISNFCISMDALLRISKRDFPLHLAHKPIVAESKLAWKFERFIFDLLDFTSQGQLWLCPRETCFAPLKNLKDVASIKQSLWDRDKAILKALTKHSSPEKPFELSQEFYYPTDKLQRRLANLPIAFDSYIE